MKEKKNIYLIGFMGSGKSTVAKRLAELERSPFIDLDDYIVNKQKLTIPEIFESKGEKVFRQMEFDALNDCRGLGAVVATGGGIVEGTSNIKLMEVTGRIVYLKASFATIYERIKDDQNRPLTKEGFDGLQERYLRRLAHYEKGQIIIETDTKMVETIVKEIQQKLHV